MHSETSKTSVANEARLLLVDDNPANLKLFLEFLKPFNVKCVTAANGKQGVTEFKQGSFDLILMDINMPVLNGFEATKQIRAIEQNMQLADAQISRIPIIALSANSVADTRRDALVANMDDCLSKPLSKLELVEAIQRWLPEIQLAEIQSTSENNPKVIIQEQASFDESRFSDELTFDLQLLMNRVNNKAELAHDLLSKLIDGLEEDLKQIIGYADSGDIDSLHEVVHRLHGGSCFCGVPKLTKASNELDQTLLNDKQANIDNLLKALVLAIEDLLNWHRNGGLKKTFPDTKAGAPLNNATGNEANKL